MKIALNNKWNRKYGYVKREIPKLMRANIFVLATIISTQIYDAQVSCLSSVWGRTVKEYTVAVSVQDDKGKIPIYGIAWNTL